MMSVRYMHSRRRAAVSTFVTLFSPSAVWSFPLFQNKAKKLPLCVTFSTGNIEECRKIFWTLSRRHLLAALPRCLSQQQQYTHQLYLTCFAVSLSPPAIGRNAIRHSSVPFHILLLLGHHCERSCSRSTVDYILFGSPSPPSLHCTFASARCLILDTLFNESNHQGYCPSHLHSPRLPLRSSQ